MISDLHLIDYAYFIGIGGIGMSALARWFQANGKQVAGYDRSPSALTNSLSAEGIFVHYDDSIAAIPDAFLADVSKVLIVYTPAIPQNHSGLKYFQQNGFMLKKRAEVLGLISQNMRCIAVAGTHGKTTTSSMIAHILTYGGMDCAAFLGGITQNYQTNLLLNKQQDHNTFVVVEADEYDRSFLQLYPEIAVITSTDADHLDIYGSADEVTNSYSAFAKQVSKKLFVSNHTHLNQETVLQANLTPYSQNPFTTDKGIYAINIHIAHARFVFSYVSPETTIENIELIIPGFHNVENAVAAISVALAVGIAPETIKEALGIFKGVKRRFEYVLNSEKGILLDDYAHHPTEIGAFLQSLRALYPSRHITAIFQPHLFSRTKDFYKEFAKSLSLADRLVLLPIYPARELQADFAHISSKNILDLVSIADKQIIDYQEVISFLSHRSNDIVATIGAGDIEGLLGEIKNIMQPVFAD
jgi:UDP-N-acetylmuramate--alanine ligase